MLISEARYNVSKGIGCLPCRRHNSREPIYFFLLILSVQCSATRVSIGLLCRALRSGNYFIDSGRVSVKTIIIGNLIFWSNLKWLLVITCFVFGKENKHKIVDLGPISSSSTIDTNRQGILNISQNALSLLGLIMSRSCVHCVLMERDYYDELKRDYNRTWSSF